MVKPERDVAAEVLTKVKNTNIDTMNTIMTSNIVIEESDQCTSSGKLKLWYAFVLSPLSWNYHIPLSSFHYYIITHEYLKTGVK